ncbi:hypothetical protein CYMTET_4490 [Cymbomonas tetramitiformis]|uniref:Uncharacterized protein n=1 Tax=Cymbomonas tetramitiformis TaxID=36881 RepID=A0AAE0LKC4_9CHLO|nr:hypothetical protein CYMTET_4490 [Cymbomonas tetramitiformis]
MAGQEDESKLEGRCDPTLAVNLSRKAVVQTEGKDGQLWSKSHLVLSHVIGWGAQRGRRAAVIGWGAQRGRRAAVIKTWDREGKKLWINI